MSGVLAVVEVVLWIAALLLLAPAGALFVECIAAVLPPRKTALGPPMQHPRTRVLVPAHDEAAVIERCLEAIAKGLQAGDGIVVVADNCSDATAEIGRRHGAVVVERHDPQRRGKGYALQPGIDAMRSAPPDVVVVVDADCVVAPGAIGRLAAAVAASGRPVQAAYVMEASAEATPKDLISAFAVYVRNVVRPRGLDRLGLPCPLTGSGMAVPWPLIRDVAQPKGITEDLPFGLALAEAGYAPQFCSAAVVTSPLPARARAALAQRTRWEHGHLQTLLARAPGLVRAALRRRDPELLVLAFDLSVPPLSLFLLAWVGLALSSLIAGALGATAPVVPLAVAASLVMVAVSAAWLSFGRRILPLSALLSVPGYVAGKVPIYVAFLRRRQSEWVRTERD